ncbi:glycoside hydrolase family 15 protein [Sporichthya polymorpha]|uniref:glycoside hydrolase family 15 protein n=1 Tax=Sporichthya polymorpha TaxID=35751 RepID=UPI000381A728|nr:glycoside hydrolase family 15 protein [Sporichthya polymorpha]
MSKPLEDYAVLGDLQSVALVATDGSVDWLCLPRFDSPACFAALLDDERAGCWRIAPVGADRCSDRRYRGDTMILETDWDSADGSVRVIDFMPPRGDDPDLVRIVEGRSGRVRMRMTLRLRFDYGRIVPWVRALDGRIVAVAGPDAVWLDAAVPTHGENLTTVAEFEVAAGQRLTFVLIQHPSHLPPPAPLDAEQALRTTESFWTDWISPCRYRGRSADLVRRSLLTLKALTYAPTGGIVAAATTSVPEQLGGVRNWDYRYCWLRDATFTLHALIGAGFENEARAWREWLLRAVAGNPADLQIMYAVDGARRIPELELDWLAGYEQSRPVRVGNAAAGQFQLDVWGEVLDGLHVAREAGVAADDDAWALQRHLLDFLEGNWHRDDAGLWEVRSKDRPFVHSKVLCWAGLDRAVQAVDRHGRDGPVERWRALRDHIHNEVLRRGYDSERNTFTQFYGSQGLDAALLLLPRLGFLPWRDPRIVGTVEAVRRELDHDGLVLRYSVDADGGVDGLPGEEGAFLICSFWLVDALQGIGRTTEAAALFTRLCSLANDVGLLAEEYDGRAGRLVGNFPQAFSHIGLVNAARHLDPASPLVDGEHAVFPRPGAV